MKKRRWIDVERAGATLYWDCPYPRCSEPHYVVHRKYWPIEMRCHVCKKKYRAEQIVGTRLLIEELK
jgi:hypothetical protein